MNTSRSFTGRGFVRVELITIVVVLGAAVALLAVASTAAQQRARLAGSVSNLQKYWSGISAFAADNENRVVSFSWRAGEQHEDPDGLIYPVAASDQDAAAHQAVSIMRRIANRPDITPIFAWIPHILYTHLPLVEYLDEPLPAEFTVSPADSVRLAWQRATRNQPASDEGRAFFRLTARPPGEGNTEKRWPFSSSYEFGPAFFSPDAQVLTPEGWVNTVSQGQQHNLYMTGANTPMGRRRLDEVRNPSQKAMVYETHAGDMGAGRSFYAYPQTRAPVLCADGSVSVRSMSDANQGFNPANPRSLIPSQFSYSPVQTWEPPTLSGASQQFVVGRVRWTRSGLRGRDFGGPEVPWVD